MLNHLIATLMICMGVANTTPIYNDQKLGKIVLETPKKENITNDYAIELERSAEANTTYQIDDVNMNTDVFVPAQQRNIERKFTNRASTNYINVIGSEYITRCQADIIQNNRVWGDSIVNKQQYDLGYLTRWNYRRSYALKITPYNINVNTSASVWFRVSINGTDMPSGLECVIDNTYMIRRVYTSYDKNWGIGATSIIDRQLTKTLTYSIEQEITDINNGYYYTMDEQILTFTNGVGLNDQFEINIIQNEDVYLFIEYILMVDAHKTNVDNPNDPTEYPITTKNVISNIGNDYSWGTPWIRGTNIIPDGTYEVIDLPGLMYEIIGMPFAFVSQAFNLTLFPGTPYQLNIANLFLSIIAVFVFIWIMGLFIKMKG